MRLEAAASRLLRMDGRYSLGMMPEKWCTIRAS